MSYTISPRSKVHRLASLIEQDLLQRSLDVGDRYLTATEAGNDFGVDQFTATRAMSLLAKRGVLIRKRGVGTFVGRVEAEASMPALRTVHIFQETGKRSTVRSFLIGQIIQGLHHVMPGFQVQSNVLPRNNTVETARHIIQQHTADGSMAGMVLLSCPREVQELVLDIRLPAVSFGSIYPTTSSIPSVDQDQFEVGRLQAQYLLDRGHRRIMLLMYEMWRPGDNRLAEGVNRAMADAGLGIGSLITRSISEDDALISKEIHRLLDINNRPTGLICRNSHFAETAVNAVRSRSLSVPEDLDITYHYNGKSAPEILSLPRVCPQISCNEQVKLVAQTLDELINGNYIENRHINIPVEFVGAEAGQAGTQTVNQRM